MIIVFRAIVIFVLLIPITSAARVFSYSDSSVAMYFRGTGQESAVGGDLWRNSSGASTEFQNKDDVEYNFSGELGFLFRFKDFMNLRIGGEIVQTREQKVTGLDSNGIALMSIQSRAVGFNPNATFEFNIGSGPTTRYIFFLGGGYTTMKLSNEYDMTTDGTTLYSGVDDYKEVVSGTAISAHSGVGLEFLMVDNVTILLEAGYRYLNFETFEYEENILTPAGNRTKGATARDDDGNKRNLDMSGGYVGISFRFYIPPLN